MIWFAIRRRLGHITGFAVRGHACFDDEGRDIVCAAVSALAITAAEGVKRHAGVRTAVRQSEGALTFVVLGEPGPEARTKADAILETLITGVEAIARRYAGTVSLLER